MGSIGAAGWGSRHRWVSGEETGTHFGLTFRFFPTPNQGKKEGKRIKNFSQVIKGKERRPPPTFMVCPVVVVVVSGASVDNLVVGYVILKAVHAVRRTGSCLLFPVSIYVPPLLPTGL